MLFLNVGWFERMDFSEAMAAAARLAASAVDETMGKHRASHVVDEDDITPYLLATLQIRLTGQIGGLTWAASVVRHRRGSAAEEARTGADMVISVNLVTPTEKYSKGVLVQAKRVGPDGILAATQLSELNIQCKKMLAISPASFVFDYSPHGMRVGSASRIAGTSNRRLYSLCGWTPYRFFLELFRCPIGDPELRSALVADLPLPRLEITANGMLDVEE